MGHGARRVLLGEFRKLLFRLFISEGMEQGAAALEGLLRTWRARDGERNVAQLFRSFVMMSVLLLLLGYSGHGTRDANTEKQAGQESCGEHRSLLQSCGHHFTEIPPI